ncbi:MAG: hypothetical protein CME62_07805 [Halobacteriovoraceae bacterium]|nr:hypothetical protein [Halobacteriovoraceae bacterium]|tara:strand:- start:124 stop:1077 length:954 start_codon:yes stop_codon:yes gene_type:complete
MVQEGRRLNQRKLAKRLDISERTLRNWKKYAMEGSFPKTGRPKLSKEKSLEFKSLIEKEWIAQGKPGWRCIKASLKTVPTRLIQTTLSELKMKDRRLKNFAKKYQSQSIEVLHRNIIWSQDTTFKKGRKAIEVIKDRGTLKYVCAEQIKSPDSFNVKKILTKSCELNYAPLVLMTDNGSGYKSGEFRNYLHEHSIIHLESLPRCPEHNGAVERAIKELKYVLRETSNDLESAVNVLNTKRRYGSKGYLTSQEIEANDTIELSTDRRRKLYDEYQKKLLKLKADVPNLRKQKLMKRKIVFELLEREGLIKIKTGSLKL